MSADASNSDFLVQIRKLRDCLQSVDFLYKLKLDELDKLMGALKKRRFPAGATVINQGDKGDAFFMISTGKVGIWANGKQLTSRYAGEFFGESALVNDSARSASVKTEQETELYILYKEDFNKILMSNPSIASNIKTAVAERKVKPK